MPTLFILHLCDLKVNKNLNVNINCSLKLAEFISVKSLVII